jgi:hypothetical protein
MSEDSQGKRSNGLFEAFINNSAYRTTAEDGALMVSLNSLIGSAIPSSQVRWAGSQRKGTAIVGSDLDVVVESRDPVTEAQRRVLRAHLEESLNRPARVLSHAVRLPAHENAPKVDVAFANAAFGSRPLPDLAEYHSRPNRQKAARALKLWSRAGNLPYIAGWAVEALVVHLDSPPRELLPLPLFLRVITWLDEKATPAAVEGVLRPAAFPRWNPDWSPRLPGRLEALRNHARALRRRAEATSTWRTQEDVALWLRG